MLFRNQAPAVSHECLMHAAHSRQLYLTHRDSSFTREWIQRAKLWRTNGHRELELNRQFITANPEIAKRYNLKA
jgi:hypothetical protein